MMGPRQILLAYLFLFGVAVPWYWRFLPLAEDTLVLGAPAWASGAVLGSLAISLFSAWVLSRRWPCEDEDPQGAASDGAASAPGKDRSRYYCRILRCSYRRQTVDNQQSHSQPSTLWRA